MQHGGLSTKNWSRAGSRLRRARAKMAEDDLEEKLNKMQRDEQVDSLLAELKRKRNQVG
jgi:hypothetical protein